MTSDCEPGKQKQKQKQHVGHVSLLRGANAGDM